MKGNTKLIEALNGLLADELTAVNQYMVHSEMSANWGYGKLHKHFEKRAGTPRSCVVEARGETGRDDLPHGSQNW